MIAVGLLALPGRPVATSVALHARLVASTPAAGDTLRSAPPYVRLLFSEPVEAGLARIRVVAAGGSTIDLDPRPDPADVRAIAARVPSIGSGGYRVLWRVVSADGHPVEGDFVFFVAGPPIPAGAGSAEADPARLDVPPPAPIDAGWRPAPILATGVEALALGALLALAGLVVFVPAGGRISRIAWVLALAAPPLLAAHVGLRAWGLSPGGSATVVLAETAGTVAGRLEIARLGLAGLAAWALLLARRPRLSIVLAFAAVLTGSPLGHALVRAPAWSIPAKAIHLTAAAIWLGGLLRLVTIDPSSGLFRTTARAVSTVSLVSVAVIGATGALQAALLLPKPAYLLTTDYGRFVLAKTGGLAALVGLGAYHRLRLLPRLEAGSGEALQRSVRREIVVFAVVLLVAAWLAQVPPPEAAAFVQGGTR